MSPFAFATVVTFLGAGAALASPADAESLAQASRDELERSSDLSLPNQPPPYSIGYEILDGEVVTTWASFGAVTSHTSGPHRVARVEVRVGDEAFDNGDFISGFGDGDGVKLRGLPDESGTAAVRRELWLATDAGFKGATEQYSAKRAAREGRTVESQRARLPGAAARGGLVELRTVDADAMRDRIRQLSGSMSEIDWLEEMDAVGRDWSGRRFMVSTEGLDLWVPTGFAVVRVTAAARAEDGARLSNGRSWIAQTASGLPPVEQMKAEAAEMVTWLDGLRAAPIEKDYLGPVLFEPAAAVELFRQLLVPELSGTPPAEEAPDPMALGAVGTPPVSRIGRRLLPDGWDVVDDPTGDPSAAGHYLIDHEGTAARRVEVVTDGMVRDLLMSRIPRDGFDASTGHGRSLGRDRRVAIPGVVTVTPRRSRSDRALRRRALALARDAGLSYVLVVRRMAAPAMADEFEVAFSGDGPLAGLTRPLEVVRLYRDGTEEAVRGLRFVGVDRRVLREIVMAGETALSVGVMDGAPGSQRFGLGAVGGLPTSWAVPPVVVAEMELRGAGGGDPRVLSPPELGSKTGP